MGFGGYQYFNHANKLKTQARKIAPWSIIYCVLWSDWLLPVFKIRVVSYRIKIRTCYPFIVKSWQNNWERITPFFGHPPEIRYIIYTTNAIESVNMSLRKIISWIIPVRWGCNKIVLPDNDQYQPEMDYACSWPESCFESVYHSVRRLNGKSLTVSPFTQNSGYSRLSMYITYPSAIHNKMILQRNHPK